jgi:enamine deaminase RidA (YjgF/YER057c/UK114 family)
LVIFMRQLASSGSYLEPILGFSRGVRAGNTISIAGTAPIAASGGTAAKGDVYGQTVRCLEIISRAIEDLGGQLTHVTRTRIMLTDVSRWEEAAKAHGEFFKDIRQATTVVQVSGFIDPDWLVEREADAVLPA